HELEDRETHGHGDWRGKQFDFAESIDRRLANPAPSFRKAFTVISRSGEALLPDGAGAATPASGSAGRPRERATASPRGAENLSKCERGHGMVFPSPGQIRSRESIQRISSSIVFWPARPSMYWWPMSSTSR